MKVGQIRTALAGRDGDPQAAGDQPVEATGWIPDLEDHFPFRDTHQTAVVEDGLAE